jgi:dihydroxy-acid dehydratase
MGDAVKQGRLSKEALIEAQIHACPSCGACQFMGTASTMQGMSEALGLSLPGTAMLPVTLNLLHMQAEVAGKQILTLLERELKPRDILTREAFENAILVHGALGGSTNATLHLPAIAHEVGVDLDPRDFDRIQRRVPVLANVKTAGKYPTEYFWYAGAVPAVMVEIQNELNLDCMTVTGKPLGENLADLKTGGFFRQSRAHLKERGVRAEDVIRPLNQPVYPDGDIAVLFGNLAPEGAVVKQRAVANAMHRHTGPARIFESEEGALHAVLNGGITPGDVIVIRYEGPKGSGMPEMAHTAESLAHNPALVETTALVTDGRFSGASRGPAVGHVSPEAAEGGPIALLEENDRIEIDIPSRRLEIVGTQGGNCTPDEMARILGERRNRWSRPALRYQHGVLGLYARLATSAMRGAYMDPNGR